MNKKQGISMMCEECQGTGHIFYGFDHCFTCGVCFGTGILKSEGDVEMKLLLLDVYPDISTVSKVLVNEGDFRHIRKVKGSFTEQSVQVILLILKERPDKVIIDKSGMGEAMNEILKNLLDTSNISIDDNGNITY